MNPEATFEKCSKLISLTMNAALRYTPGASFTDTVCFQERAMTKQLERCWIPLGSFGIAVLLSFLAGGAQRFVSARQAGGTTGCSCTFKIMEQNGSVDWETEGPKSVVLKKISISNGCTVCTSSEPPNLVWAANWTATNLTVAYTIKAKGFKHVVNNGSVIP